MSTLITTGVSVANTIALKNGLADLGLEFSVCSEDNFEDARLKLGSVIQEGSHRAAILVDLNASHFDEHRFVEALRAGDEKVHASVFVFGDDERIGPKTLMMLSRGAIWRLPMERLDITCKCLASYFRKQAAA